MDANTTLSSSEDESAIPYVEVIEQPKSRGYRFRYGCEGKTAGCLAGESSRPDKKVVPSFKVHNVPQGHQVIAVISCVTTDDSHRPHPHKLVGKDCEKGVCTLKIRRTSIVPIQQVGIQCVKRNDIELSLAQREAIKVNPFSAPYFEKDHQYDMKKVQLAIQAFILDKNTGQHVPLPAVLTQEIYDFKTQNDLTICRLDKKTSQAKGGEQVFLLCDKVNKDDIQVLFSDDTGWEAYGEFSTADVHKQFAIVFKTPPYKNEDLRQPVDVQMCLLRPSDDAMSERKPFTYTPNETDPYGFNSKRRRKMPKLNLPGPEPQMPNLAAFRDKKVPARKDCLDLLQKATQAIQGQSSVSTTPAMNPVNRATHPAKRRSATVTKASEGSTVAWASEVGVSMGRGEARDINQDALNVPLSQSPNQTQITLAAANPSISQNLESHSSLGFSPAAPCLDKLVSLPSCLSNTQALPAGVIMAGSSSAPPIPAMINEINTPAQSRTHMAPTPTLLPEVAMVTTTSVQPSDPVMQPMTTEDFNAQQLLSSLNDMGELNLDQVYQLSTADLTSEPIYQNLSEHDLELFAYLNENPGQLEADGGSTSSRGGASRFRQFRKMNSQPRNPSNNRKGT